MKAINYIKTATLSSVLYVGVGLSGACLASGMAHATDATVTPTPVVAMVDSTAKSGQFTKATYKIQGDWEIVKENGQTILRLSDDFKTKRGPDLKIFLNPNSLDAVTGATATSGAIKLGELKSNKGAQDYVIPADIDLANFGSLLIHCEAFSKLWGGANL